MYTYLLHTSAYRIMRIFRTIFHSDLRIWGLVDTYPPASDICVGDGFMPGGSIIKEVWSSSFGDGER